MFSIACDRWLLWGLYKFSTWFPRVGVAALISWAWYTHLRVCHVLGGLYGSVLAVWGSVLALLALIAYYRVCSTGPGSPREFPEFMRDEEASGVPELIQQSVLAKRNGRPRYCNKCKCWKPDRTHHCRKCRQCVLKMDHHCPWFSACVGFRNYKYFVQFLWYVVLLCGATGTATVSDLYVFFSDEQYNDFYISVNEILLAILSVVFGLAVAGFAGFTTWLMINNTTTLENIEGTALRTSLAAAQFRYGQAPDLESVGNVFDMGSMENAKQVLGQTYLQWLLPVDPTLPPSYDGSLFPVNETMMKQAEQRAQTELHMARRAKAYELQEMSRHSEA